MAILPILLYIGMLIGSQAFQETPKRHAPGDRPGDRALDGQLGLTIINSALAAAGDPRGEPMNSPARCCNKGVYYHGLQILGGGSTLGGLILGAMAVFIIDRNFVKAAGFALAGGVLTFFGLMHGEHIGIAQTPVVALSYLVVAAAMFIAAKFSVVREKAQEFSESLAPLPEAIE